MCPNITRLAAVALLIATALTGCGTETSAARDAPAISKGFPRTVAVPGAADVYGGGLGLLDGLDKIAAWLHPGKNCEQRQAPTR